MTTLKMNVGAGYEIHISRGILGKVGEYFDLDRKVLVVTDSGVPSKYAQTVAGSAKEAYIYTLPEGEGTKSIKCYTELLSELCRRGFGRRDCVVAVGGGVMGDLAGFVAASYMRGIDFYNVPTTTLSVVDSSIGGKVAVNLDGVKNIVGAFYQPKGVLIDTDTLKTLDRRQFESGIAEVIKMAATSNAELFSYLEGHDVDDDNIEYVISEALKIKKAVVETDEKETGLRKILNFGHTYGHAVESITNMSDYYHGECVAIGMIPMSEGEARERITALLRKHGLPTEYVPDLGRVREVMGHDKKAVGKGIDAIIVKRIGECETVRLTTDEIINRVTGVLK